MNITPELFDARQHGVVYTVLDSVVAFWITIAAGFGFYICLLMLGIRGVYHVARRQHKFLNEALLLAAGASTGLITAVWLTYGVAVSRM